MNRDPRAARTSRGFTLLELLVVGCGLLVAGSRLHSQAFARHGQGERKLLIAFAWNHGYLQQRTPSQPPR